MIVDEITAALTNICIAAIVVAHGATNFSRIALPMTELVDGVATTISIRLVPLIGVVVTVRVAVMALRVAIITMMAAMAGRIVGPMMLGVPIVMGVWIAVAAGPSLNEA